MSIKRRRAYYERQKKQQQKEFGKFKSTQSTYDPHKPTQVSNRKCKRLKRKTIQGKLDTKYDLNANQLKLISYSINYLDMKMILEAQSKESIASMESKNSKNEDNYISEKRVILAGKDKSSRVKNTSVQKHNGIRGGASTIGLSLILRCLATLAICSTYWNTLL